MKKLFAFFILGTYAAVAMAAVTSEQRIKADKVVVGRPAPATDPLVEFQGTTQRIKANRTTGRMQFTNDGTNFKNIGSGSGGAGGVNLLTDDNGDFEAGDTAWTESGGTFSIETTNPLFGVGSGKWDSSASAQTLISNLKTIEKGMVGRVCGAELVYKWPSGVAADLSFQVLDAASTVIFSNDLSPTTGDNVAKSQRNFDCGVLGSQYRVRILSNVSNPAEIIIDNVFLGSDNNSFQLSQSTFIGSAFFATTASCSFVRTNTALGAFSDVDCPGPTVVLNPGPGSIQTTDVNAPQVTVNNLPAGTYRVVFSGSVSPSAASAFDLAINDGTDTRGKTSGQSTNSTFSVEGIFVYTSTGNKTFSLFGSSASGSLDVANNVGNQSTYFHIYRYPTAPADAITLETSGSSWSGYHDATCSFPRTNTAYGDPTADASCALVERQNSGFGTVTSYAGLLPGIVFTPKITGKYYVCAAVKFITGNASSQSALGLYDATTLISESQFAYDTAGQRGTATLCGVVSVDSVSSKTLSIQTKVSAGTITLSTVTTNSVIDWLIYPISQQMPAPVFTAVNNKANAGESNVLVVSAYITNAGTPALSRSTGSWVNSLTDNGVGDVTINTTSFSTAPMCTCSGQENIASPNLTCQFQTLTSTAIRTKMAAGASGGALDRDIHVICVGK